MHIGWLRHIRGAGEPARGVPAPPFVPTGVLVPDGPKLLGEGTSP